MIAVQDRGAHKYYTWVKKKSFASEQRKPNSRFLSRSAFMPRRRRIAQTSEAIDDPQPRNAVRIANNSSEEVMWLRDLLPLAKCTNCNLQLGVGLAARC